MNINEFRYENESKFDNQKFIEIQYTILFNRMPDASGLQYYLNRLEAGHSRDEIVLQMVKSSEFRKNIDSIKGLKAFIHGYEKDNLNHKKLNKNFGQAIKLLKNSDKKMLVKNLNPTKLKENLNEVLDQNLRDILRIDKGLALKRKLTDLYKDNINKAKSEIDKAQDTEYTSPPNILPISKPKIWEELLTISSGKKNIWFGLSAPLKVDFFDFGRYKNFRAPAELHGTYDVAWLYENNILSYAYWKLLLDEAVRLLKPNGFLIIRALDNADGTIWEIKSILDRSPLLECRLDYQIKLGDGSSVMIFSLNRKYIYSYTNKNWTIGILTNGMKNQNVINLVQDFAHIQEKRKIEFIIVGPYIKELEEYNVTYINLNYSDDLPRISEKKRLIMRQAKFENIAIFHDRYKVNSDFFNGFDLFGYDFEFVTIAQSYETGEFFPGYAGLPERKKRWQRPMFDINNNTLHDGHFINGGLMVLKKHLCENLNFNGLLLHNEAEDVELTYQLMDNGIMPRYNMFSSAVTIGITPKHTETFQQI